MATKLLLKNAFTYMKNMTTPTQKQYKKDQGEVYMIKDIMY